MSSPNPSQTDWLRVAIMQAEATANLTGAIQNLNKVILRLHDAILLAVVKLTEGIDEERKEEVQKYKDANRDG